MIKQRDISTPVVVSFKNAPIHASLQRPIAISSAWSLPWTTSHSTQNIIFKNMALLWEQGWLFLTQTSFWVNYFEQNALRHGHPINLTYGSDLSITSSWFGLKAQRNWKYLSITLTTCIPLSNSHVHILSVTYHSLMSWFQLRMAP